MNIRNEEHAHEMLAEWLKLPLPARKREIKLAIEKLELSCMYYEQKGNDKGMVRSEHCIVIMKDHLQSLGD